MTILYGDHGSDQDRQGQGCLWQRWFTSVQIFRQEKMEEKHTINPVMHEMKPIPPKMAFAHGIIAGFGFGASVVTDLHKNIDREQENLRGDMKIGTTSHGILNYNIITPVYIHNIHNLGIGFFRVIFTVVVVWVISYFRAMRIATKNRNEFNSWSFREDH